MDLESNQQEEELPGTSTASPLEPDAEKTIETRVKVGHALPTRYYYKGTRETRKAPSTFVKKKNSSYFRDSETLKRAFVKSNELTNEAITEDIDGTIPRWTNTAVVDVRDEAAMTNPESQYTHAVTSTNEPNIYQGRVEIRGPMRKFFLLPSINDNNSYEMLHDRQKINRRNILLEAAALINHGSKLLNSKAVEFLEVTLTQAKKRVQKIEVTGKQWKISIESEVLMMKLMNASDYARRELKSELLRRGEDFLNSTLKYDKEIDNFNLKKPIYFNETIIMDPKDATNDFSDVDINLERLGSSRIENISDTLQEYVDRTSGSIIFEQEHKSKIWLKIGVDAGGGTTKVTLSLANRPKTMVNSPFNSLFIAAYTGGDKYSELIKYCDKTFSEIDKIETLVVGNKSYEVEKFLVADMNAMSAVMGLKGPSSRFPCPNCTTPAVDIKQFKYTGAERNQIECDTCLKKNSNNTIDNISYDNPPLLGFDKCNLPPAQIHICVSPVTEIFKSLESTTRLIVKCDYLGEEIEPIHLKSSSEARWTKVRETTLKELELKREVLKSATEWSTNAQKSANKNICYDGCIFKKGKKSSVAKTVVCCNCGRSDHQVCGGLSPGCCKVQSYKCWNCCLESRSDVDSKLKVLRDQVETCESEIKSRQKLIDAKNCETTQNFRKLSDRLGVKLGAFQGRLLPGNHVHNFLRNFKEFFNFVREISPDNASLRLYLDNLENMTHHLNVIHGLCMARFLTDDEVEKLKQAAESLKNKMIEGEMRDGTPKYHSLTEELPRFVQKFRTIGILSEQGVESGHVQFDYAMHSYRSMKELGMKLQKSIIKTNQRSIALLNTSCSKILEPGAPKLTKET